MDAQTFFLEKCLNDEVHIAFLFCLWFTCISGVPDLNYIRNCERHMSFCMSEILDYFSPCILGWNAMRLLY
jgi:hypothetical protein